MVGVPDGGLAARDLTAGDYAKAAKRLKAVWPDSANDPARLINLGNAYAGMGAHGGRPPPPIGPRASPRK